jgi:O-antigen/teichoic acid export membrane protein
MSDKTNNNNRIAKNTILLYFRMLITMGVMLYTSRVVLSSLGVEDYGIYNVVGGVVAMFSFLNAAMTSSTQRFLTFEIGRGNIERLKQVFVTSVNLHILISFLVVMLAETVGFWFLQEKMVIADERMYAAMWVYHISVLTTVIAIMSYPYNAAIIANEKMSAFAYISIIDVTLKLIVAYLITIGDFDRLILYAVLVAASQLFIRFCYSIYCSKHFKETHYYIYWNKGLFKEMLSFAAWNLWGNFAYIIFTQGLNLMLNIFFGTVVNAARAISVQVQSAISQFANNFQSALNPQITKTYAAGDLQSMNTLIFRGSKFTFLLLMLFAMPICIEIEFILNVWLKEVPDYTVIFVQLMVAMMVIDSTANPLMTAAAATGKVKKYQTVLSLVYLSNLPLSYIALKMGAEPWSVFVINTAICCVNFFVRLLLIRPMINFSIRQYINRVCSPCILVATVSSIIPVSLHLYLPTTTVQSLVTIAIAIASVGVCSLYLGLDRHERNVIFSKIRLITDKLK